MTVDTAQLFGAPDSCLSLFEYELVYIDGPLKDDGDDDVSDIEIALAELNGEYSNLILPW